MSEENFEVYMMRKMLKVSQDGLDRYFAQKAAELNRIQTTMKHHYPDCQGGPTCNCDEREREEMEREMSDTPETDREFYDDPTPGYAVVSADFARKLERERDEAREMARAWRDAAFGSCRNPLPWEEAGDE